MKNLLQVSIRQQAIFISETQKIKVTEQSQNSTFMLIAELSRWGYGVSEELLHTLHAAPESLKRNILAQIREIMGAHKNWTPLVKGWDIPTGESYMHHLITLFANIFKSEGTILPCGHTIPQHTFPLERYNGCPFCGTPFEFGKLKLLKQGSKKKVLELWKDADMAQFFKDTLESKTALDATQLASLQILLAELPFPQVQIGMKETLMTVIDVFIEKGKIQEVGTMFHNPNDLLRYLWYKHTGFLQIIEPKTIVNRMGTNNKGFWQDNSLKSKLAQKAKLKLSYNRRMCYMVATWLNELVKDAEKAAEIMHPKREIWVRFIRALRLAEYSKKPGFEALKKWMDVFYNEKYAVWAGKLESFRLKSDAENTFAILKQRPGLFARSLFANMLWFGAAETCAAFAEVIDKVPARLVFTLNMYAQNYFTQYAMRTVKPLGGVAKQIEPHALLTMYKQEELETMREMIEELCLLAMKKRFAAIENKNKTIFIAESLFKIPVSIGDRSESVQDMPAALMGTRFPIEGNTVRLFMQWGTGLPAQHLDMDLSCHLAMENGASDICSYSRLTAIGCKHSGDIRSIPEKIGTAEYIELDVAAFVKHKVKYVTFTCNAYSNGSISANLVIGWMNSKYPMKISERSGVAYDPSCVQHQVRVTQGLSKGLVFGVLDVQAHEIIWLEMPFQGQVIQQLNTKGVESLLKKLNAKLSIGNLLKIKAEAQGLNLIETPDADEKYTAEWARNTASVTKLLVD